MLRIIYIVIAPIDIAKAVIIVSFVFKIKLLYSWFKRLYIALNNAPPGNRGIVDGNSITIAGVLDILAIISLNTSIEIVARKTEKNTPFFVIKTSYIPLDNKAPSIIYGIFFLPMFSVMAKPKVPSTDKTILLISKYNHRSSNAKSDS